MWSLLDTSSW